MARPRKIRPEHIGATVTETAKNAGVVQSSASEFIKKTAFGYEGRPIDIDRVRGELESLSQAQLRKERALADKHESDARQKRGELIEKQPMLLLWAEMGQTLRDQLMGLPDRVAGECAALTDPRMVRDYLLMEIKIVLKNLPETLHGSLKLRRS
jgi:hypothetical protein